MNLHGIVKGAIGVVNPLVPARVKRSNGYTIGEDYSQIPTYVYLPIFTEVQALSFQDLQQIDSLNIQGERRSAYLDGAALAVVRPLQVGGDVFLFNPGTFPEGDEWLVAYQLEMWPDWCKVVLTVQVPKETTS